MACLPLLFVRENVVIHEALVAEVNIRNKELQPPDFVPAGAGGSRAVGVWRVFDDIPLLKNGPRGDGHPKANNVWRLYQALSGKTAIDDVQIAEIRKPPPVPFTSFFSRSDGIVSWQCCVEQESHQAENIDVHGSHSGMVVNRSSCMRLPIGSRKMKENGSALIETAIMV